MKEVKKGTIRSKIKRGDTVVFISGREYNRYEKSTKGGQEEVKRVPLRGEVIAVDPRRGKVKVEGAQIMKRHRKAVPQMSIEGGIIESEGWVDISNVAVVDPKTGKPTRVKYETRDGKKVRVAKSGELIPEPPRRTNTKKKDNDNE
ncbi:MAG TPA: 50S ribosomal protein L24 [Pyrinomonadaceae bacterium]|jgi:large subunit ribosomal protein L24